MWPSLCLDSSGFISLLCHPFSPATLSEHRPVCFSSGPPPCYTSSTKSLYAFCSDTLSHYTLLCPGIKRWFFFFVFVFFAFCYTLRVIHIYFRGSHSKSWTSHLDCSPSGIQQQSPSIWTGLGPRSGRMRAPTNHLVTIWGWPPSLWANWAHCLTGYWVPVKLLD
jgi:hypothetical protein